MAPIMSLSMRVSVSKCLVRVAVSQRQTRRMNPRPTRNLVVVGMEKKRLLLALVTKALGADHRFSHPEDEDSLLLEYKSFAGEVVASASFAEAIWFYPSEAVAIKAALTYAGMFQTFAHNKFQPTEYISFSNNIVSLSFPPMNNNISEAEKLISHGKVAIVFVDPIHCNGEICSFKQEQLQSLRTACDKAGVLLAFDEFQCGLGVTGRLWAHEVLGVKPDLMMIKFGSLGIYGVLMNKKMKAHICKFEEDYIPDKCSEVLECFRLLARPDVLDITIRKGIFLKNILSEKLGGKDHVREIRASGLLAAVELDVEAQPVVDKCKENGLVIISAVGQENNIIRIKLPLGIGVHGLEAVVNILQECLKVLD